MMSRRELLSGVAVGATGAALGGFSRADVGAPGSVGDLCDLVDPFIGTGGHGHTYPGATVPFGVVQLSPDTNVEGWDSCSGYHRDDPTIMGFSHTHLSGTGVGDMMDVLIVPATGPVRIVPGDETDPASGYRSRFERASEVATPGYYKVVLADHGITAELTATARAGLHRYRFPAAGPGHLVIDLRHGAQDPPGTVPKITEASLRLEGDDILVGGRHVHQWGDGRVIYFALKLSRPCSKAAFYRNDAILPDTAREVGGGHVKCVLHFPDAGSAPLLVKVGLSSVDIEGALRNLDREIPGWDFEATKTAARASWETELARMKIEGGAETDRRIFYTALYHSMLAPTLFSDSDGRYRAMDSSLRQLPPGRNNYSTYSLWDTYRALHPLFTLIQGERAVDMTICLARMAEESPAGPPVWPLQGTETLCMIGWHSAVVLAEAATKGLPGIDFKRIWPIYRDRAFKDRTSGLPEYRRLGYIPSDQVEEAVSKALEYAYDDWAIARLADAVGADEDARILRQRSLNYRHHFDAERGFMHARLSDGSWTPNFDPRGMAYSRKWFDFKECNAWQATFLNQHDIYGYIKIFGGEAAFEAKLDELFTTSSELPEDAPPDIAGLVGQYAHGNEPSHHIAYLYAYTGAPHKTQARVRSLMKTMYRAEPDGLAGNEDCGQMSAWYLMSAIGLYPVDPVAGLYVFGGPLFPRAELAVGEGRRLTILAEGDVANHPYVQSVRWNGKSYRKSWIAHADLVKGGELVFVMGPKPNLAFGHDPADRPPSFTVPPL